VADQTLSRRVRHGIRVGLEVALGCVLLVAGLVMLVTPGPGVLAVAAGVALLARHNPWTRRAARSLVARLRRLGTALRSRFASRDGEDLDRAGHEDES
jgi:UPF0716 family protein affecting phage T7 exclusion